MANSVDIDQRLHSAKDSNQPVFVHGFIVHLKKPGVLGYKKMCPVSTDQTAQLCRLIFVECSC